MTEKPARRDASPQPPASRSNMFTATRHCERSEAIPSKWMAARRCMVFALTFSAFIIPGVAFACMELDSYEERIKEAEIIFEGHLTRFEKHELFARRDIPYPSLVMVYVVDKNLKNTVVGQEVKVLGWNPEVEEGGNIPEVSQQTENAILVLDRKLRENKSIFANPRCPDGIITSPIIKEEFQQVFQELDR